MITFICQVTVRPGNAAAYEALVARVREQTLANEPGVLWYSFGKSADVADRYVVIEVYRDAQAHAAHMQAEWVVASIPQSRALVEGRFDIRQFVSGDAAPALRQMKDE